jgi:hypothetical protein
MRQGRTRGWLRAAIGALSVLLVAGCDGSKSGGDRRTVTVTGLGWYEENIDPSFWTSAPPNANTAFYDFWIHYDGDIAFADLEYARVYLPDGSAWNIAVRPDHLDATNRKIGGWYRWMGATPNVLPIGALRAEVKLTDGVVSSLLAYIPAPASSTSGTYTTMHSEDATSPPLGSAPMVRRATLGATNTFTAATQTISLTFSIADAQVHNGWIWFYDATPSVVATSPYFADPATGAISPLLAGSILHKDGTTNTLTLSASDVNLVAGKSFDQITRFRVVLTDGAQYQPSAQLRYDCRSISAAAPLTVQ